MQQHDGAATAVASGYPAVDVAELPRPFDAGFLACPHARLAALGRGTPVVPVATPAGRRAFVVTGDAEVRAGLLDARLSLRRGGARRVPRRPREQNLMNYEPADHARIRRLATPALSERRVAAYRPVIEAAAGELLDRLPATGPVDLLAQFSRPYAFRVVCELLGVDPAERPALYRTSCAVFAAAAAGAGPPVVDDVHAVMEREILARQRTTGQRTTGQRSTGQRSTGQRDVLARLVASAARAGGVSLDELVSLAAMLLFAGLESTAQMICMCVVELLARPSLRTRVSAEPALLPAAIEEMLRLTTPGPFATTRYPTEDLTLGGCPVRAGEPVLLSLVAANRDPAVYDHPDDIDLARGAAGRHLTFGWGAHFCPGAAVARLELCVALRALLDRYPQMALSGGPQALRWQGTYRHRGLAELRLDLAGRPG